MIHDSPDDPLPGWEKLFDAKANSKIQGEYTDPSGAMDCEVFVEPYVSKTEAREAAAQLLGLPLESVKCNESLGCWITADGGSQSLGQTFSFRGATWFGALEAIHKFLVAQVVANEQPPVEEQEDLRS